MPNTRSNDRYSLERKRQLRLCSKEVKKLVREMIQGKDEGRLAVALGVSPVTFTSKVQNGRFTASELYYLAGLCGYRIKIEEKEAVDGLIVSDI